MSDYIERQAVIDAVKKNWKYLPGYMNATINYIKDLPSADVAPVVRCGQCGYWHGNDGDYGYCYAKDGQGFGHAWGKNDFCSYGERKE